MKRKATHKNKKEIQMDSKNMSKMTIDEFMAEVLKKGLENISETKTAQKPQQQRHEEPKQQHEELKQSERKFFDPMALERAVMGMKSRMLCRLKTPEMRQRFMETKSLEGMLGDAMNWEEVKAAVEIVKETIMAEIRKTMEYHITYLEGIEQRAEAAERKQTRYVA